MFLEDKPHFFGRRKGRVIRKTKTTLLESFLPNRSEERRVGKECL